MAPQRNFINMDLTFYIWDFWLYPLKHIYIWGLHAYFEVCSMKNKKVAAIYIWQSIFLESQSGIKIRMFAKKMIVIVL